MKKEIICKELSGMVMSAVFEVHKHLGMGLLESAYEGAMVVECTKRGLVVERQKVYPLIYKGEYIGAYIADMVINGSVILELKAVKELTPIMEAQLINYLKLSGLPVGYLINFAGSSVRWQRFVNTRGKKVIE